MNQIIDSPAIFAGDRYVYFHRIDEPDALPGIEFTALALSQINRFNGHTFRPYSVAEHSLLVTAIAVKNYADDLDGQQITELALACLMHDAHEAFIGDMASPLKGILGEPWYELEGRVERAVRTHFGVLNASDDWREQVKRCDLIALATERAFFMPHAAGEWPVLQGVKADPDFNLDDNTHRLAGVDKEFANLYLRLMELRSQGGLA